jgi:hypothetical protein
MQLLGLHELPCTAQSHERLVQVSHVCSVKSRLVSQSTQCRDNMLVCSVTLAGSKAVCTATHLRGCFGILQITGGTAGTTRFGSRCSRSTAVV